MIYSTYRHLFDLYQVAIENPTGLLAEKSAAVRRTHRNTPAHSHNSRRVAVYRSRRVYYNSSGCVTLVDYFSVGWWWFGWLSGEARDSIEASATGTTERQAATTMIKVSCTETWSQEIWWQHPEMDNTQFCLVFVFFFSSSLTNVCDPFQFD